MSAELTKPLIISMVGLLSNKVKLSMQYAHKNKKLAEQISSTVALLTEQLLPHFCKENLHNYEALNSMQNLFYLLA